MFISNISSGRYKFLIFFFVIPTLVFSQGFESKGKLFFNIGPEYRITPIYDIDGSFNPSTFNTNIDLQNSGFGLNIGTDFFITENFGIGFNNSFRYDLITTGEIPFVSMTPNQGAIEASKGLLIGYHLKLFYHWNLFKKGDLIIGAGLSFLNRNSEFSLQEPLLDINDQVVGSITTLANFNYTANKIYVGYGSGKSKLLLGMYITRKAKYFSEPITFMVPFLSYSYDFGKLELFN